MIAQNGFINRLIILFHNFRYSARRPLFYGVFAGAIDKYNTNQHYLERRGF